MKTTTCIYCGQTITAKYPYRLTDGTPIHPRCKRTWEEETNRLMHQRGDFEK